MWNYHRPEAGHPLPNYGPFPDEMVDKANEQMEDFIEVLEGEGVTVDRIEIQDFMEDRDPVSTPDWTQLNSYGANNVRDMTMIHGNFIIECASGRRSRYWEFLNLRDVFEEYFEEDDGMVHIAAPKPRLTDESYVENYDHKFRHEWSDDEKRDRHFEARYSLTEHEPLWDAADAMRFGKDVFHQVSAVTNWKGFKWLKQLGEALDLRFHHVQFDSPTDPDTVDNFRPWHTDVDLVPLREGLAMYNPDWSPITDELWELFEKNDWELVPAARPSHVYESEYRIFGGYGEKSWISMNTLSLGPETVCVEAHETQYIKQLEDLGFDVIEIPYDHVIPFGGALHCTTLDVTRKGGKEDYFPNQIDGY
jgi:glycine amidinotransferase